MGVILYSEGRGKAHRDVGNLGRMPEDSHHGAGNKGFLLLPAWSSGMRHHIVRGNIVMRELFTIHEQANSGEHPKDQEGALDHEELSMEQFVRLSSRTTSRVVAGPGLIHGKGPSFEVFSIKACNCGLPFLVRRHFGKPESLGPARVIVLDDLDRFNLAELLKGLL